MTSFVGRERELEEAIALLSTTRLLTLTGPGGTGKTRLALQVAASVADRFPDGVWYVAIGDISDPALVVPAIATGAGRAATSAGPTARPTCVAAVARRRSGRCSCLTTWSSCCRRQPPRRAAAPGVPTLRLVAAGGPLRIFAAAKGGPGCRPPWTSTGYGTYELEQRPDHAPSRPGGPARLRVGAPVHGPRGSGPSRGSSCATAADVAAIVAHLGGVPLAIGSPPHACASLPRRRSTSGSRVGSTCPARAPPTCPSASARCEGRSVELRPAGRPGAAPVSTARRVRRGLRPGCHGAGPRPATRTARDPDVDVSTASAALVDQSRLLSDEADGEPRLGPRPDPEHAIEHPDAGGDADLVRERHARACLELARAWSPSSSATASDRPWIAWSGACEPARGPRLRRRTRRRRADDRPRGGDLAVLAEARAPAEVADADDRGDARRPWFAAAPPGAACPRRTR